MARIKSEISNIAFDYILEKINNLDLKSGDSVSDYNLAKELSISRTPVKEAVLRLMNLNLVEKERTKFSVKPIKEEDIIEILKLREMIELYAVNEICMNRKLSSFQISKLNAYQDSIKEAIDSKNYKENFKIDMEFHTNIISFVYNARAMQIMDNIIMQSTRLWWMSVIYPPRYSETIEEHQSIIRSLSESDIEKATKAVRMHIANSINNYLSIMKEYPNWEEIIIKQKPDM